MGTNSQKIDRTCCDQDTTAVCHNVVIVRSRNLILVLNNSKMADKDLNSLDSKEKRIPVPVNPVILATLRAIYAAKQMTGWSSGPYGRPFYQYATRAGRITLSYLSQPTSDRPFHPSIAMYYEPRMNFIHSGNLRQSLRDHSAETADVFLILMSYMAQLQDPMKDIAEICLRDIARLRDVRVRHGSIRYLYDDFKHEVLRLSDLHLSMNWDNYLSGGKVSFGDRLDNLLHIYDVKYKSGKDLWQSFQFRCGKALSHFLNPEGLFWLGYYSKSLLQLNPSRSAFTKKLGTYWSLIGIVAGKKGLLPKATPRTILEFCGEEINGQSPGKVVDSFIEAHQQLKDVGVLEETPVLEPTTRGKGYFVNWLDKALTVRLSENLWKINIKEPRKKSCHQSLKKNRTKDRNRQKGTVPETIPETIEQLRKNQVLIKKIRTDHRIRQIELARALGITRQTLSNYERCLCPIPARKASKLIQIMQNLFLS